MFYPYKCCRSPLISPLYRYVLSFLKYGVVIMNFSFLKKLNIRFFSFFSSCLIFVSSCLYPCSLVQAAEYDYFTCGVWDSESDSLVESEPLVYTDTGLYAFALSLYNYYAVDYSSNADFPSFSDFYNSLPSYFSDIFALYDSKDFCFNLYSTYESNVFALVGQRVVSNPLQPQFIHSTNSVSFGPSKQTSYWFSLPLSSIYKSTLVCYCPELVFTSSSGSYSRNNPYLLSSSLSSFFTNAYDNFNYRGFVFLFKVSLPSFTFSNASGSGVGLANCQIALYSTSTNYNYNFSIPLSAFGSITSQPRFLSIYDTVYSTFPIYDGSFFELTRDGFVPSSLGFNFSSVPQLAFPLADQIILSGYTGLNPLAPTPSPVPTLLPTVTPTPLPLIFDEVDIDGMSDGSTLGFLDTLKTTFDRLPQMFTFIPFMTATIGFLYAYIPDFSVLFIIPLIAFLSFVLGRNKS